MKIFLHLPVLLIATGLCLLSASCSQNSSELESSSPQPTGPTRTFALGFTDFPHAKTIEAFREVYKIIDRDADMAVMHFDDGIPWQAALDSADYSPDMQAGLDAKVSLIPKDHLIYLAVTPLSFERDDIATHKDDGSTLPWRERLDDPDVIRAFSNHCERMISLFSPDYFAYTIEANLFHIKQPDRWEEFIELAKATYTSIKSQYPSLPVFLTIQADFFHRDPEAQLLAIESILPYTDYIAISAYPFLNDSNPRQLSSTYFSQITDLAPDKPVAFSETAWPAEDISSPYPITIPASPETQSEYLAWLLDQADILNATFVTWFFARDYDLFWEEEFKDSPNAPTVRIWKDTGLYDGSGKPRPALEIWREALSMERIERNP